ncbi:MAG: hypothetical protein IJO79_03660 [Firmicutes bacterium]|nr:hypothetical protein [Bacillota bacterium]
MERKRIASRKGRYLAIVLSVLLILTLMPVTASAAVTLYASGTAPIQNAVNQAQAGTVIKINAGMNNIKETIVIPKGKDVTIDLSGYNLYTQQVFGVDPLSNPVKINTADMEKNPVFMVEKGASLTILSSGVGGGEVVNRSKNGLAVVNEGTLTLKGGSFSVTGNESTCVRNSGILLLDGAKITAETKGSVAVANTGTMTVKSGSVTMEKGEASYGIKNTGTLNVTGGTITATSQNSLGVLNQGTMTISGGFLYAKSSAAGALTNEGTVSQTGGSINSVGIGWGAVNKGTYNMTGGDIAATGSYSVGLKAEKGSFVLTKGTIRATGTSSTAVLITSGFENKGGLITATGATAQAVVGGDTAGSSPETQAPAANSVKAVPTPSAIIIDGQKVSFDSYNIKGNNYFKLRDLAYALSGSAKQFDIVWDQAAQSILMFSGQSYTAVSGEMAKKDTAQRTAKESTAMVYLDNARKDFKAYNIEGNNYFKLRDLGAALDFGVFWDGATNTITIDTTVGYTE